MSLFDSKVNFNTYGVYFDVAVLVNVLLLVDEVGRPHQLHEFSQILSSFSILRRRLLLGN
jgi:hypothetical protein